MQHNIRSAIASVSQNKRVRAVALEVLGGKASVKIAGSSQVLYGLPITGGNIIAGQEVFVDYTTGTPVVHSYEEQSSTTAVSRVSTRKIVTDPDLPATSPINEAPIDDKQYARKNASWIEVTSSGSTSGSAGIEEAPIDNKQYARKNADWVEVVSTGSPGGGGVAIYDSIYGEVITTSGSNFSTSNTFVSGSLRLYLNGIRQDNSQFTEKVTLDGFTTEFETYAGMDLLYVDYNVEAILDTGIEEAPTDGNAYVRMNGEWADILTISSGSLVENGTATGGSEIEIDGYRIHIFVGNGTLSVTGKIKSARVLLVAGGGGGGADQGGGGGGGEVIELFNQEIEEGSYNANIGQGGIDYASGWSESGQDTTFMGLTANGGEGGLSVTYTTSSRTGGNSGNGNVGGNGSSNAYGAGGGAGNSQAGQSANVALKAGDGGEGTESDITGTMTGYGGGGGGGNRAGSGQGLGKDGGGDGGYNSNGAAGRANTGGGGGGGGWWGAVGWGADGGSGIVVVRYPIMVESPEIIYIEEAPLDAKLYVRTSGSWQEHDPNYISANQEETQPLIIEGLGEYGYPLLTFKKQGAMVASVSEEGNANFPNYETQFERLANTSGSNSGDQVVPQTLAPEEGIFITGYDAETGVFSSGSISCETSGSSYYIGDNHIINGDFDVWQRGESFASVANGDHFADMFSWMKTSTSVHTVARSTDVPTFEESGHTSKSSLKADCTTVDSSIDSSDLVAFYYKMEGYDFAKLYGKTVTLSFWVKATKTGIYCIGFRNYSPNRSYVAEYTINTTNTWEKKSITLVMNPGGTNNFTTGVGLRLSWIIAAGSTYQTTPNAWNTGNFLKTSNQVNGVDSTNNDFFLAQIKLEIGSVATDFKTRGIGFAEELAICQRRYWRIGGQYYTQFASGFCRTSTIYKMLLNTPVSMAGVPSLSSGGSFKVQPSGTFVSIALDTSGSDYKSYTSFPISVTVTGGTVGQGVCLESNNDISAYIDLACDLA